MSTFVKITGNGQITIPAEFRRKHNLEVGDRVMVSEDDQGRLFVIPASGRFSDFEGAFRPLPGVGADPDFGNVIREAMEERAERLAANLRGEIGER